MSSSRPIDQVYWSACDSGTTTVSTRPRRNARRSPGRLAALGWSTTTGYGCGRTPTGRAGRSSGCGVVPAGHHAGEANAGAGVAGRGLFGGPPAVPRRPGPRVQQLPSRAGRGQGNTGQGSEGQAADPQAPVQVPPPRPGGQVHGQQPLPDTAGRPPVAPEGRGRPRPLPAEPSSVTVTLDGSSRYHASFVVEVAETPLPPVDTAVGVDLGLTTFAALSTGEKVDNLRWLRQREKALRRSQRNMGRKRKGSRNREKARRKVARLHLKVADARRDLNHQLSTRLIRENQTVCVETLNIKGLGRSKLAKSVHDAGWGQFTAMLEYKATLYGRTLVKVDRMFPSSQLCSACGRRDRPKPLKVRTWICPACGAHHDRDLNAAKNILAEGLSVAACGGHVRPGASPAVADEAGTTLAGAA